MAMLLREAVEYLPQVPTNFPTCGDFQLSVSVPVLALDEFLMYSEFF